MNPSKPSPLARLKWLVAHPIWTYGLRRILRAVRRDQHNEPIRSGAIPRLRYNHPFDCPHWKN